MNDDVLPLDAEIALLKDQMTALQNANQQQEQALTTLKKSDAHQYTLLKFQRKIQSACIAAFGIAIAIGFAGFDSANRQTLERIVVGIIGAAAAGHVGSNFLDRTPDEQSGERVGE